MRPPSVDVPIIRRVRRRQRRHQNDLPEVRETRPPPRRSPRLPPRTTPRDRPPSRRHHRLPDIPPLMTAVPDVPCPNCGQHALTIETRYQAKPLGTYSLSGTQMKFSATAT